MDLIIPEETLLFHGTSEPFLSEEITGGGYDRVLWTADTSTVAQTYIPISGSYSITGARELAYPSKDPVILQIQHFIGIYYDLFSVEWDYMDRAISYWMPEGWDHVPTFEEVEGLMDELGWEKNNYGHYVLRSSYINGVSRLHLPGEKKPGRLFIFKVIVPLRIFDSTYGGEIEGDLMNVEYHNLSLFQKADKAGYDGIKINDFGQSGYYGNFNHTSIGLFERAKKKMGWVTVPAVSFDWDDDTPISEKDTPEYKDFLLGKHLSRY